MARKPESNHPRGATAPSEARQAEATKAAAAIAARARAPRRNKDDLPALPGRRRVVIEAVAPQVDCGRFPIKRVMGEMVVVEADVFADGHDRVTADLLYRHEQVRDWRRLPMQALGNDRMRASFRVERLGRYLYTVVAWVDHFATWREDLTKRYAAHQALELELAIGAQLARTAAARARKAEARRLLAWAKTMVDPALSLEDRYAHALAEDIAAMGFDVVYLPPIHPIGEAFRKGRNNAVTAAPDDVGSPWAIGSRHGGHKAVHPQLGTLEDFRAFVAKAAAHGLEVALDIAFQASPDHPYVREHPEWFLRRPDGSIQYAENPPKKYRDIYPFHFEGEAWPSLWRELKSVFEFWIAQGVRIFRVDNPHTKPFRFWEWCIAELRRDQPDLILLSEAFTRPKVMHRLAKLGFSQSYTYFTWRNSKRELVDYFTELTQGSGREYFRPNVWPNTPDILSEYLQVGGWPAFVVRLILAATLSASYGIYGPAFELGENASLAPGSEEYLDSEKYQLRQWDMDDPASLKDLIARVNAIRRSHPALQHDWGLRFHQVDNDQLLAYSKRTPGGEDAILVVVNLDVRYDQSGWLTLPLEQFGLAPDEQYQVEDLLTGARYIWQGPTNYVALSPRGQAAHILRLQRPLHREQDFQGYM